MKAGIFVEEAQGLAIARSEEWIVLTSLGDNIQYNNDIRLYNEGKRSWFYNKGKRSWLYNEGKRSLYVHD